MELSRFAMKLFICESIVAQRSECYTLLPKNKTRTRQWVGEIYSILIQLRDMYMYLRMALRAIPFALTAWFNTETSYRNQGGLA